MSIDRTLKNDIFKQDLETEGESLATVDAILFIDSLIDFRSDVNNRLAGSAAHSPGESVSGHGVQAKRSLIYRAARKIYHILRRLLNR